MLTVSVVPGTLGELELVADTEIQCIIPVLMTSGFWAEMGKVR